MDPKLLPQSVDKAIENATAPLTEKMGQTFAALWTLAFGKIDLYSGELQKQRQIIIAKKFEEKFKEIDENKLIEPQEMILGPTIEGTKYVVNHEELLNLFANLAASSIDSDYRSKVHPSFAQFIKEMSPLDAKILSKLIPAESYTVAEYRLKNNEGYVTIETNVFLEFKEFQDITLNANSITNLNRLGLIEVTYQSWLTNKEQYKIYFEHPYYRDLVEIQKLKNLEAGRELVVEEGLVRLTPLGQSFIDVCINK